MSRTPAAPRASLLLLAYLAFVSLGLPDGLIGVGWPSIRVDLGVPTEAVGVVLTAGTVAYLTSSVLAGFTLARLGVGWLLAGSTLLAAVALTGYALSPALAVLVGFALVLGIGSGAIDSGLNAYAAGAFGPRHMNWMHAFFGLGVALGPLIMTGVLGAGLSWRWGYAAVAIAQLALATAFALSVRAWRDRGRDVPGRDAPPAGPVEAAGTAGTPVAGHLAPDGRDEPAGTAGGLVTLAADQDGAEPGPRPTPIRETLRLPAVWLGGAAFAVYVAIEVTTGLWAYLLLTEGRGVAGPVAGLCVSGYWGSLFLGRVVQGLVAERLGTAGVLRGSLLGLVGGTLLIALPAPAGVTVAGLLVVGFAAAPVFPLLTLTTAERVGPAHADRTIGLQMGAAGVGAALVPAGVGVLLARTSVVLLGATLVLLAVALLALHVVSTRRAALAA
ncbi:MFS transporter [Micromonospora sp. NPDC050495]|uniref:MFS transporter n=1 Tax=Micromonospora sp. NPDC050495 TaxID=3154936 RepID=UPI0033FD22AA